MSDYPSFTIFIGWNQVIPAAALGTILPMLAARFLGPHRSWGPLRDSFLLVAAHFVVTGMCGAMLAWWGTAFDWDLVLLALWPFVAWLGLPLVALSVLGGHLWMPVPLWKCYSVALLGQALLLMTFGLAGLDPLDHHRAPWLVSQLAVGASVMLLAWRWRSKEGAST